MNDKNTQNMKYVDVSLALPARKLGELSIIACKHGMDLSTYFAKRSIQIPDPDLARTNTETQVRQDTTLAPQEQGETYRRVTDGEFSLVLPLG